MHELPPDPDWDDVPPTLTEAASKGPLYMQGVDPETGELLRSLLLADDLPGAFGDARRAADRD